ncbi:MAG: putative lipid II flippase FtsW [Candidatus Brocadiae bacterium]|nr:putative lipid II flippase FtsW [Candidatus Brocadiia bacterium]
MTQASRGAFVFCVLALCALGTVMIYSATVTTADRVLGDGDSTLVKHLFWLGLALCGFAAAATLDWRKWEPAAPWLFAGSAALLLAVLIPGVGAEVNGARRWFRAGSMSFQPSELMKIALPVFLAWLLTRDPARVRTFRGGFLPAAGAIACAAGLTALEPDFGTAALLAASGGLVALLGGVRFAHALPPVLAVIPVVGIAAWSRFDHVKARLAIFLDPDADPLGKGYQLKQGLIGLGAGGKYGVGLGLSKQKLFFLPEKHTDYIFSILGEELGFVGTIGVVVLFLLLLWHGRTIARRCASSFGALATAGMLVTVGLQAAMNIAVVTASVPPKGISLPFISFGGSGLLFTMVAMGFVVAVGSTPVAAPVPAAVPPAVPEPVSSPSGHEPLAPALQDPQPPDSHP